MGIDARIHYKLIFIVIMLLGVVPKLLAELVNIAGVDVAAEQKIAKIIDGHLEKSVRHLIST
jgi:hypothetical protein